MSIIKLNNRSVKDATAFGSITSLGELTFISKQTASSSATISFTSGIDSTYKEYIFYFVNMHPSTDAVSFQFQGDTGTNTNYNQTITSSYFRAWHRENDTGANLGYETSYDQAQGTSFQTLIGNVGTDNDQSTSGYLHIFNPSSSVFVKHFISRMNYYGHDDGSANDHIAGYFNITTALTRFQFKMSSGNIDSGDIILFGLN